MQGWTIEYQYTAALIAALIALGLIFFLAVSAVVLRSGEGLSDRYMKLTVIILVIVVALSVSISGFSQQTTNSVLGLIGTIVGYLLGRMDTVAGKAQDNNETNQPGQ
jgi:FtsH-binding integral membrane protein